MRSSYEIMRQPNDRDALQEVFGNKKVAWVVSGSEFRDIRCQCGYAAREFAVFLKEINAPITTSRSVYRLETLRIVPARYVDAMEAFVGTANFKNMLEEIARRKEERRLWREENERAARATYDDVNE